jgi:hypothetical protein
MLPKPRTEPPVPHLPAAIIPVLLPFAALFTRPTWEHVQVLLLGTLLAQGPRTVTAALRVMGLSDERRFERYHRVLNRARWSGLRGAQILLGLLTPLIPSSRPWIIAVDETLERRKGERIAAKGMYRDAVRSSRSRVVTCLGLHWICMALLVPLPWSPRPWALPFLTLLAPSKRADETAGRPHRTVVDWTIVMVRLVARWIQRRRWVLIGDGSYACIHLGWECVTHQATLISRLRLDARLFARPAPVPAGRRGPKPKKGRALAKLATRIDAARQRGETVTFQAYGHPKTVRLLSETGLWYTPGCSPLPIRWVLVVDPTDAWPPQAFFSTDLTLAPAQIVEWFTWRWSIEVTFEEARRHLGVETQRQWTALAIARTTPVLLALFSLVCLMVYGWRERWATVRRSTAWYLKPHATFSDCLVLVRRTIWADSNYTHSTPEGDRVLISAERLDRLLDQLAATA